jgi:molybdopterin converting factor small subunit
VWIELAMQVKVLLFGHLRTIGKERSCTLDSDDFWNLETVIAELCRRYGRGFEEELMSGKTIRKKWKILVNGTMVKRPISDVPVSENSEIALIPTLTGG